VGFLEKQLKQKEGTLKQKEVYLRDQVKLRNFEISKLTNTKDEFLRNITHESNTPMTGILSMCDVLYSCYDQLDSDNIKRTIKDIVNSGDRLKTYVNSIVDLSKLNSNQYELTKKDINLGELAKERTFLYKKIFSDEAEKQEFIFDIEDEFIVNCDRYYITQAIDNLISNAVIYGKNKTITISIKRTDDNNTSFSISDQGIGIPKTELLSIFEKFAVSSKTKTPAGGRGVGLALCKSVIEAHDGTITATSKGKCATFTFTLPK
jgi:signal transduction histidine kinase